jgi:hypothetical protein
MKGWQHRIIGILAFAFLYYFKLFPNIINQFLSNYFNILLGFFVCLLFSAGKIRPKKWIHFGLSPDNDSHKKMKRSMIYHSTLFPAFGIICFPNAIIYLAAFFYSMHVLVDLLNPLSFEGKRHTYFLIFVSTMLFFVMIYM